MKRLFKLKRDLFGLEDVLRMRIFLEPQAVSTVAAPPGLTGGDRDEMGSTN